MRRRSQHLGVVWAVVAASSLASGFGTGLRAQTGCNAYIYGMHDYNGTVRDLLSFNGERRGWVLVLQSLDGYTGGTNPDVVNAANDGLGVLVRLHWGYGSTGTLPPETLYGTFASRAATFISTHIDYAKFYHIGNEPNLCAEWAGGGAGDGCCNCDSSNNCFDVRERITTDRYASCFQQVYNALSPSLQADAKLLVTPTAVWAGVFACPGNTFDTYDFICYAQEVYAKIPHQMIGGFAFHPKTHDHATWQITDASLSNPVFGCAQNEPVHWYFKVYEDLLDDIPSDLRDRAIFFTELNPHEGGWTDSDNGYVEAAFNEVAAWNSTSADRKITAMMLYRWDDGDDRWDIWSRGGVQQDLRDAVANGQTSNGLTVCDGGDPPPPPPAGENLALGKAAFASSVYLASEAAAEANDGLIGAAEKWTSEPSQPSWWTVDLGAVAELDSVVVHAAQAGGEPAYLNLRAYTVRGSLDGSGPVSQWTVLSSYDSGGADGAASVTHAVSGSYRYVAIHITNSGIDAWARVPEVEVHGETSEPAFRIGLDPGAPIVASTGDIAFDGQRIADSGSHWVRINFILGPWSSPGDSTGYGSSNLTWFEAYDQIVNDAIGRGLVPYGLIGAEAVKSPNPLNSSAYVDDYAANFTAIVGHFKDRMRHFESFNEPNDWAGGSSAQVQPFYFAMMLEDIYRAVKIDSGHMADPSWTRVQLISGPLFTHDQDTGAQYFTDTYNAGRNQLGWNALKAEFGTYPCDGVGYHIYIGQGTSDPATVESGILTNVDAVWSSLTSLEGSDTLKRLWVSEIGWNTASVSEAAQAGNVDTAIDFLRSDIRATQLSWFVLRDFGGGDLWGLERTDTSKKPGWTRFQDQAYNLALEKPAFASSEFSPNESAAHAADGVIDGSEKWTSQPSQPSWWYVDLGEVASIHTVAVHAAEAGGEAAYMNLQEYTVRGSNSSAVSPDLWTTLATYSSGGADGAASVYHDLSGGYRFIGIRITDAGIDAYARVPEVEVRGRPEAASFRIEAERYFAAFDTTAGNSGGAYRSGDVDIEATQNDDGAYNIGWTDTGEWLDYELSAPAGTYRVFVRHAGCCQNGTIHLELDGQNVTGSVVLPVTGGWQTWATKDAGAITVGAGVHTLRIYEETPHFNINYLEFVPESGGGGGGGGGGGPIASEDFETLPAWSSEFDAAWGSAASWSIVSGGQSGSHLEASRTSEGSSVKVQVFTVPSNTLVTVSAYMKAPSFGGTYWAECAAKPGSYTARDFDENAGTWTLVKKFDNAGQNGNGNVWTQYSVQVATGSNTQISIGYKLGSSGGGGPTVGWDTVRVE